MFSIGVLTETGVRGPRGDTSLSRVEAGSDFNNGSVKFCVEVIFKVSNYSCSNSSFLQVFLQWSWTVEIKCILPVYDVEHVTTVDIS